MILGSDWSFGLTELIQVIAAFSTFFAVLVSLYLANRARRIKKKVILSDEGIIRVVNVGDSKFTISGLGYIINKTLFFSNKQKYSKPLSEVRQGFNNHIMHFDVYHSSVVLEPGDCVETKICVQDNSHSDLVKKVFIVINYKTYYYKHDFKNLIISNDDSMQSCSKNNKFNCFLS